MLRTRTRHGLAGASAPLALFVFILALGAADAAFAGPWVQTKDGYFATGRLSALSTSKFYDANGDEVDQSAAVDYKDRSLQLDAEYGISNKVSLVLGMPVQFRSATFTSGDPNDFKNNGFGDLLFGFKYGFLNPEGKAAVALEADGSTPTGYNSQGLAIPPMGRGKFSYYGRLHAGTTFDPAPVYVQAEFGYRGFTDSNVSPALVYSAEAGFFATPRVLVLGQYQAEKSRDTDKYYYQDLAQAGGLVQYRLNPHLDLMAGVSTSLSGKNVEKGTEVRLGVSLKGNGIGRYRGQTAAGYAEGAFPGKAAPVPAPAPAPPAPAAAPSDSTSAPATPK